MQTKFTKGISKAGKLRLVPLQKMNEKRLFVCVGKLGFLSLISQELTQLLDSPFLPQAWIEVFPQPRESQVLVRLEFV